MSLSPAVLMLAASTVGVAVGPALLQLGARGQAWRAALRGLSMTLVGGLVLVSLGPDAVRHGGWPAVVAGLLAVAAPFAAHHGGVQHGRGWVAAGMALLLLDATLDGAALALVDGAVGFSLGMAVLAHRLPMGLVVFGSAQRSDGLGGWAGATLGWFAVACLMLATLLGFVAGGALTARVSDQAIGVLEGLVAGALLHVVADAGHDHEAEAAHDHHHHAPPDTERYTRVGQVLGVLGALAIAWTGGH
jgi:hypothetical protein